MKKLLLILLCLPLLFSSCKEPCYHCDIYYDPLNGQTIDELDSLSVLLGYQDINTYVKEKRRNELVDWVEDWNNHCFTNEATNNISVNTIEDLDTNGIYDISYSFRCEMESFN